MTRLLVSVRSAAEAEIAVRGGASLIDVKEPANGSLGRASDEVLCEVARTVACRRPLSAALGELMEARLPPPNVPLAYAKWGLAGWRSEELSKWQDQLRAMRAQLQARHCRVVAVAYADWQRADAPTVEEVCDFAIEQNMGAFLVDTWHKDGSTLLDWLSVGQITDMVQRCCAEDVPIALAGSLGLTEMRTLLPLRPHWFAVRSAVCADGQRDSAIEIDKVRQMAALTKTM